MDERSVLLLENLLAERILNRAIRLRNTWAQLQLLKGAPQAPDDTERSAADFMEQAVEDIRLARKHVAALLL